MSQTLFDKPEEFKEKLNRFTVHKKKLYALNNYSEVVPFQHKHYLLLIKKCMDDGFLQEKEAEFLCYMVEKYKIDFLDWSHRTPWLKNEMLRLAAKYDHSNDPVVQQSFFDFSKAKEQKKSANVFDLMAKHQEEFLAKRA